MMNRQKSQLLNIVGPQVRKLRNARNLTQEQLAARCNLAGFDLGRSALANIESRMRVVTDLELALLAKVLKAELKDFYPSRLPSWKPRRL